ncbi:MAG: hypothetical protein JRI22_02165 [Deltaproteobacteria bacterium]|nr:hypothetical protein [Deltaproteobacteria bacterium]
MEGCDTTMEILENVPVSLDMGEIGRGLHMGRTGDWSRVQTLAEAAQHLIKARAVYKVCYIDTKLEDAVRIEGTRLTSRVLRKHLDKVERVFPYVVTLGHQLEETARLSNDLLQQFYIDTIGNVALAAARRYLEDHIRSRFAIEGMSYMAPGSLSDWSIGEQKPLFSILGDVETAIGVRLTESLLMIPRKSVSGIYFPTEVPFFSCLLCPREVCMSRKAGYDENLAREYGILK